MHRKHKIGGGLLCVAIGASAALGFVRCSSTTTPNPTTVSGDGGIATSNNALVVAHASVPHDATLESAMQMITDGRQTFRYDTFGDEAFWGDTLKLHEAIKTVSPKVALSVGLKVDIDALPASVVAALKNQKVDLDSPATTALLLQANAVVGVTGIFERNKNMTSIGIQCSLCHSTVDDSFAPGIGHRLDGWANRDLDVGQIIALAPDLSVLDGLLGVPDATVRTVLKSWGPGKFDAELVLDGKAFRPDNKPAATLIPPAFGLAGINLHTWTGWGSVPHWNAFVANLEMHGKGTFFDPRLDDATVFPIAAKAGFGHVAQASVEEDRITPKLGALQVYQLAIVAPTPPAGSFDPNAAARGAKLFEGQAKCATCHVPPIYTEPGWNMHTAAEIGIDDFQSSRAPDKRYRTSPLKGLYTHVKGGFYHDGRFGTLIDVVDHYDHVMSLHLSAQDKSDIAEYLKSL